MSQEASVASVARGVTTTPGRGSETTSLLEVSDLCVRFETNAEAVRVVNDLSFRLDAGRSLAIVGESGSGKTISCRALTGLAPRNAVVTGAARFGGVDLLQLTEAELRSYLGARIGIVFQDPSDALNPTMRVGHQISEAIRLHTALGLRAAWAQGIELLRSLRMPAPEERMRAYPHELSGGMRQRVMLAIGLAGDPQLLIADESMKALDVTTQAETVRLIEDVQRQRGLAVILISHDLRLAARFADDILVMRGGSVIEYAPRRQLFQHPRTAYTRALLNALHDIEAVWQGRAETRPAKDVEGALLEVMDVVQDFRLRGSRTRPGRLSALSHVSFRVDEGETLGIVGESGSGKTTLARTIVQLLAPTSGRVLLRGHDLTGRRGRRLHAHRRCIQMVFQDPFGSLNPRWRVADIVEEPLICRGVENRRERRNRVEDALALVGLPMARFGGRRPGQLSGGQCQRAAIARAVAVEPALIVCDEPFSSLDVLTQAQILRLFERLRQELALSYLFISHDLAVVSSISDRIAVMHSGQLCEVGPVAAILESPAHPYTRALIASARNAAAGDNINGEPPSPTDPPTGCRFRTRCPVARQKCALEAPTLSRVGRDHFVACHVTQA